MYTLEQLNNMDKSSLSQIAKKSGIEVSPSDTHLSLIQKITNKNYKMAPKKATKKGKASKSGSSSSSSSRSSSPKKDYPKDGCPDGKVRNKNGRCVNECGDGKVRDMETGKCVSEKKTEKKTKTTTRKTKVAAAASPVEAVAAVAAPVEAVAAVPEEVPLLVQPVQPVQASLRMDLTGLGITRLKEIAKKLGMSGYSKYTKDQADVLRGLIEAEQDKKFGKVEVRAPTPPRMPTPPPVEEVVPSPPVEEVIPSPPPPQMESEKPSRLEEIDLDKLVEEDSEEESEESRRIRKAEKKARKEARKAEKKARKEAKKAAKKAAKEAKKAAKKTAKRDDTSSSSESESSESEEEEEEKIVQPVIQPVVPIVRPSCNPVKKQFCDDDDVCFMDENGEGTCMKSSDVDQTYKSMTFKGKTIIGTESSLNTLRKKLDIKEKVKDVKIPDEDNIRSVLKELGESPDDLDVLNDATIKDLIKCLFKV